MPQGLYHPSGAFNVSMSGGGTVTDISGTIASGGVAQVLSAANPNRRGLFVQNNSSGDLWIRDGGTAAATQPSIKIAAGATYEWPDTGVPTTAISIFGATTAQAFTARSW